MTNQSKNQRDFARLLLALAAACGVVVGAGTVRMGACHTKSAHLDLYLAPVRVAQLEADLKAAQAKQEPLPPLRVCSSDALWGACAISWGRLFKTGSGRASVGCGARWIVTWQEALP